MHALEVAKRRLPGLRHLGVVVDAGSSENTPAALRFLSDLEQRVEALPPNLVGTVRSGVAEERRFLETHALQFMDPADIRALRAAVEERHRWEVTRATGMNLLSDEEDPPPPLSLAALEQKYAERLGNNLRFPDDRFVSPDGKTAVLVIQTGSTETSLEADEALLGAVQDAIAALGFPDAYAPGLRVGFGGDVPTPRSARAGEGVDSGHRTTRRPSPVSRAERAFYQGE